MADLGAIADALQGMGAGFSGDLPRYMYAKQEQEAARQKMIDERRRAMTADFITAGRMVSAGMNDSALKLLDNRLVLGKSMQSVPELGGDFSDTQAMRDAIASGDTQSIINELPAFEMRAQLQYPDMFGKQDNSPMQFGATFMGKDGQGNLFQVTQARDPNTGQAQTLMTPVGHSNPEPIGGFSIVGQMGMTAPESVIIAGQRENAQQGAIANNAAAIAANRAAGTNAADMGLTGAPSKADIQGATAQAEAQAKVDVERNALVSQNAKTYETYKTGMDKLVGAFANTDTGPVAGRMPAVTAAQQSAEGSVAAMAPVLKQMFRTSGEGVFTDRDQQLLLDMLPTRKDHPEAIKFKVDAVNALVQSRLLSGQQPASVPGATSAPAQGGANNPHDATPEQAAKLKAAGFVLTPNGWVKQ